MKLLPYKTIGFTILELMVVVAIAGILAAIALPNYSVFIKNNCLTTSTNSMVSSFQIARSTAIKHKTDVTLTASSTDTSNEWGTGWTITFDEDRNKNCVLDTGEDYDGDGVLDGGDPTLCCS